MGPGGAWLGAGAGAGLAGLVGGVLRLEIELIWVLLGW